MYPVMGIIMWLDELWPFPILWWIDPPPFLPDEYVATPLLTGVAISFSNSKCVVLCLNVSDTHGYQ
jgi:hypothetical protein